MSNIDETELARLEALAKSVGVIGYSEYAGIEERTYIAAACNAVPALIAEIRRLRRNYECSEKSLQRHEHMVAELMEKVEAWEWYEECRENMEWQDEIGWNSAPFLEAEATYLAAREAVHADRE